MGIITIQNIVNQPFSLRMKAGSPCIEAHSVFTRFTRLLLCAGLYKPSARMTSRWLPGGRDWASGKVAPEVTRPSTSFRSALDDGGFAAAAEAAPTRPEDHRED